MVENHSNPRNVALSAGLDYGYLNRFLNEHVGIGFDAIEVLASFFQVPYSGFFLKNGTSVVAPPPPIGTTFSHALELLAAFEKAEFDTKRTVLRELGLLEKPDPAALLASPRIPKGPQARKTKKKSPV
jgi:hypothetical protein